MGKPWFFFRLKEISDLNLEVPFLDKEKMKRDTRILVVDDKSVPFLEILKSNNYSIKRYPDITDLDVVKNFDIILCDIQGVGKKLNPTLQGVHLVQQIKKLYPFKQVIAFTANPSDPDVVAQLMNVPHAFLQKDASEREWMEALDLCITRFASPVDQWAVIREALLKQKVSTKTVAHLESNFVKSIQKKNSGILLDSLKDHPTISPEMIEILKGLAALVTTIFSAVK